MTPEILYETLRADVPIIFIGIKPVYAIAGAKAGVLTVLSVIMFDDFYKFHQLDLQVVE